MPLLDFPRAVVLAVALIAVAFDVRTRRIPNWLTFGAALG
jgi:Flp pilus assembly protein protease CpaA